MAVKIFPFTAWGLRGVGCVFGGRDIAAGPLGGNISLLAEENPAPAQANRRELRQSLEGMADWRECRQVHGTRLLAEPGAAAGDLPEADGMMTSRRGIGLMIKTADCQPLFVAHKSGRFIMALHVGWRGNRAGFPQLAVAEFCRRYGLLPRDLLAARGPSLGPAAAEFVNFDSEWGPDYEAWHRDGRMDLWALSRAQLVEAGLLPQNIHGLDLCTYANRDDFFSHRRDGSKGRQASLIWIRQ